MHWSCAWDRVVGTVVYVTSRHNHSYHHSLIINATCFSQTATECIHCACSYSAQKWIQMRIREWWEVKRGFDPWRNLFQRVTLVGPTTFKAAASCSFASVPGQQTTLITTVENRVVLNSPRFNPTVDFDADRLQWYGEIIWSPSTWHYTECSGKV